MVRFKGYHKESTSDFMMRIDKRERIIACVLGDASLTAPPTSLEIIEHPEHEDYLDWKINLIDETDWLFGFSKLDDSSHVTAKWKDSNKLRIYRKWLYRNNKKTFEHVLKYMHSPLFAAIILMDSGLKSSAGEIVIDTRINYGQSADMLSQWFHDVLGLYSEVVKRPETHYVSFDYLSSKKYLDMVQPIVEAIPSMYERLYATKKPKAVTA